MIQKVFLTIFGIIGVLLISYGIPMLINSIGKDERLILSNSILIGIGFLALGIVVVDILRTRSDKNDK